jgi:uncharacterized protein (TIGR03083 family)
MTASTIDVAGIPPADHGEAMALAEVAYARFLDLVRRFEPSDWTKPTDCTEWDVRALVGHNLGIFEAAASVREMARQQIKAMRRAKREGIPLIDAMTALEVEERAALTTTELVDRLARTIPKAIAGRKRTPSFLRTKVRMDLGDGQKRPLGYLIDTVFTRDAWMHRIDLARATGRDLVLTPDHDGRLVAGVVADWAVNHGRPFHLVLTGPAGGTYVAGDQTGAETEHHELDAVEFCRTLAGRAPGAGLLSTEVMF